MTQDAMSASAAFLDWLHQQVLIAGRGDGVDTLEVEPRGRFWLGRLAPELSVAANPLGQRGERLEPCAVGLRVRPSGPPPWTFRVYGSFVCWSEQPDGTYAKSDPIQFDIPIEHSGTPDAVDAGMHRIQDLLAAEGISGQGATVRVEHEDWRRYPELIVTLVNVSPPPADRAAPDANIYETHIGLAGLQYVPFELEALPDSFRYDRSVPAIGINCGVELLPNGDLRTSDVVEVDKGRPEYWTVDAHEPDLSFDNLAADPIPALTDLVHEVRAWGAVNWSTDALEGRAGWTPEMLAEARSAASAWEQEVERLESGLEALKGDADLLHAFRLANGAMKHAARERYTRWRPFQIGFLVSALNALTATDDAETVDTVWFATGGGKTETYLGLLVTAVLFDRLRGKGEGITAWSRFPLRMLSLQQTQRFADALAGAELMRRQARIPGHAIRLGFFVGMAGTPNDIPLEPVEGKPDATDPTMPRRYQVLLRCPFCHSTNIEMDFDRASWTLRHRCLADECPWPEAGLPFHVVDQELYRFLPAVVVGTLDKAALIGMQAAMRGFVGPPAGLCDRPGHGYCYAPRSKSPSGCLVPGCRGNRRPLSQASEQWAPTFRLQDELHLLRDSLGAVDSHYEAALDHLQTSLGGPRPKIIASSATLTGFERQVDVLYQRAGRVFPLPGPSAEASFWSQETTRLARRYVAVAPRGVTLEFVSDRTLTVLQEGVRRLRDDPEGVCAEAGISQEHVEHLLDTYGVNVVYGNTIRDVEAARRSLDTQIPFSIGAETLTGRTPFDEVRNTLERLERPESNFDDRIHVLAASSMLSHGVDIDRLNVMVMLGLPLTTAEFIQTTARVGRRWPGLVYVLHRIVREREVATFAQFDKFVRQGDRFVEPVPVTRRSRRVLALTTSGLVEARRLAIHEPSSARALTTIRTLRSYYRDAGVNPADEAHALAAALGFEGPFEEFLREDIVGWLRTYFAALNDPATSVRWPNELSPTGPVMRSLRDVEEMVPIVGEE